MDFRIVTVGNSKCNISSINLTSLTLTDINYIPHVPFNFVFVSRLTKTLQCFITFSPSSCTIQDLQTKKVIREGYKQDGIYYFQCNNQPKVGAFALALMSL